MLRTVICKTCHLQFENRTAVNKTSGKRFCPDCLKDRVRAYDRRRKSVERREIKMACKITKKPAKMAKKAVKK